MPSLLHEGLIALVRDRPAFAAELLRELLHVEVPAFTDARLPDATLSELVPVEYRADAVVLFVGDQPVFGASVEAQLQRDDRKRYTWPLYAVAARARYECPFVVIVVTPDASVARWASEPIDLGGGSRFVTRVVGPDGVPVVTDVARAIRDPQMAVLSVVAHGQGEVETATSIALAAVAAVSQLPDEQRLLYSALIESALSEAARKGIQMVPDVRKFFSESQRRSYDRGVAEGRAAGRAEGEARGEARALLKILNGRGLAITADQERQILECADPTTLDRWLDRALSVTTVEHLLES